MSSETPAIDTRTYRASPDPNAGAAYEPVDVREKGEWNVGLTSSYSFHPVDLKNSRGDIVARPVEHAVHTDLVVGAGLGARSFFAVSLPFSFQSGDTFLPLTAVGQGRVPGFAMGDLGLHLKHTLVSNVAGGGFGVSLNGTAFVPTGDQRSFSSDRALRIKAGAVADYSLKLFALQAGLGFLYRAYDTLSYPTIQGHPFGDELHWSVGAMMIPGLFFPALKDRHRWEIGARGWVPVSPVAPFSSGASALSPVMLAVSERAVVGKDGDTSIVAAVDIGLNQAVGVPVIRGILGLEYAPSIRDKDHDGISDDRDQCPDLPEDKDGKEDNDGCPDVDDDEEGP